MRKRVNFSLSDLKNSKVASLNQHAFEDVKKPVKQKFKAAPGGMCEQAQWIWGQLSWWSIHTRIPVEKEYKFHPDRKWRADFAIPSHKILIEYEGLNSEKSGHTTLKGYTKDTEKYKEAAILGWTVFRYTVLNYKSVIKDIEKIIFKTPG